MEVSIGNDALRLAAFYLSISELILPPIVGVVFTEIFLNTPGSQSNNNSGPVTPQTPTEVPKEHDMWTFILLFGLLLYTPFLLGIGQYLIGVPSSIYLIWATMIQYPFTNSELVSSPIISDITQVMIYVVAVPGFVAGIFLLLGYILFSQIGSPVLDALLGLSLVEWLLTESLQLSSILCYYFYLY